VLPVAKDDEMTKKGIGATMLKLWHCSGLLSKVSKEEFGYAWQCGFGGPTIHHKNWGSTLVLTNEELFRSY
jgi:hypothetical protein